MFWCNFVNQCEKIEKSPTVVVEDLGFKRSAVTSWKKGALPQVKNRKKIADYFGISVEELMGTKKEPAGQGELDDESTVELTKLIRKASPEKRKALIELLKSDKEN